jgi:ribosomal protein L11 methyltransferase
VRSQSSASCAARCTTGRRDEPPLCATTKPRDERPGPPTRVIRLAVRVRREDAELVLAQLLELAPSGVEEAEVGDGVVEYAVYGSPGELPQLPELHAAAGDALVEVATSELPDDWGERWKRFHRPVLIESPGIVAGLHVRPPWEPPSDRDDVEEIVIDPGQAFGTGAHATTRMCLELLLELSAAQSAAGRPVGGGRETAAEAAGERQRGAVPEPGRGALVDIGTGSGVLAIAAARLGFGPVVGLDNEPESVEAARANASVNGVELEARRFDLRSERLPTVCGVAAPTVLANLLKPLLIDLARSIEQAPEDLIVGGLLTEQVTSVVVAFEQHLGLREYKRRTSGEWAAVWLRGGE